MHTRIGDSRKHTLLYSGMQFLEVGAPQAAIHSIIPSMLAGMMRASCHLAGSPRAPRGLALPPR